MSYKSDLTLVCDLTGNVTFYKYTASSQINSNSSETIIFDLTQIQYDSVKYIFNTSTNTLTIKTLSIYKQNHIYLNNKYLECF